MKITMYINEMCVVLGSQRVFQVHDYVQEDILTQIFSISHKKVLLISIGIIYR